MHSFLLQRQLLSRLAACAELSSSLEGSAACLALLHTGGPFSNSSSSSDSSRAGSNSGPPLHQQPQQQLPAAAQHVFAAHSQLSTGLGWLTQQQQRCLHASSSSRSSDNSSDGSSSSNSAGSASSSSSDSRQQQQASAGAVNSSPPLSEPDIEELLRAQHRLNELESQPFTSSGSSSSSSDSRQQQQASAGAVHNIPPLSEPDIEELLRAQHRLNELESQPFTSSGSSSSYDGASRGSSGGACDDAFAGVRNGNGAAAAGGGSNGDAAGSGPGRNGARASLDGGENEVLSSLQSDDRSTGGVRLRFRRKTPTFQVIEFHASGAAVEEFRPRTAGELGLHPRDVTLFAPLSRLAAPQRATIAVHDGKILVKTEIVKAVITADKAVLIKGRRQRDTQKLAQAILAANDQRLMALKLHQHQQGELSSSISPGGLGSVMGSCERAASAADLLRLANAATGSRSSRVTMAAGGNGSSSSSSGAGWRAGAGAAAGSSIAAGGSSGLGSGRVVQPDSVAAGADAVARAAGSELKDVPFEMLVLEVLLDATTEYFYTKVQHLNWMLESIASDIRQPGQPQGALDKAHQLIPIQKFLTSVKNDVKETCEAIKAALADDETLEELCLSWHLQQRQHAQWMPVELQRHKVGLTDDDDAPGDGRQCSFIHGAARQQSAPPSAGPGQHVRMLTEMLESYEREIQSLEGSINEAEEDLENTRSIWHMQLDSSRNHIIMVNLWLSMLNISVMATTIVPAFFGMNLSSGLSESDPLIFYVVCGCSLLLSALSYPASRFWYTRNWRKINKNELFEQKMLRVLLVQNIEDVDDIITALRRHRFEFMDRRKFRQVVVEELGNRAMTPAHIDFLWQVFDRNRDGFLSEAELMRPLNTYHSMADKERDIWGSPSTEHDARSDARLMPAQLGSLDGLGGSGRMARHAWDDDEAAWQQQQELLKRQQQTTSVRTTPPQQQQQPQPQPQPQNTKDYYPGNWMDDERFHWD